MSEINYDKYLENENVQWFLHNLMEHEADKTSDGNINYGGFNQGGSNSTAFGFAQFTGITRNEILEKYKVDAWSNDLNSQFKATLALLHMDGDLDNVASGDFESVFGKSSLKTNKDNQMVGGSRWQAFYPEGHKDFLPDTNKNSVLFSERPEGWQTNYQNYIDNAIFDPKTSWSNIGNLDKGLDIQKKKRDLYTITYKDSLVPQHILDSIVINEEDPGNVTEVDNDDPFKRIDEYEKRKSIERKRKINKNRNKEGVVSDIIDKISFMHGDPSDWEKNTNPNAPKINFTIQYDENGRPIGTTQRDNSPTVENQNLVNREKEQAKKINTFNYEGLSGDVKNAEEARLQSMLRYFSALEGRDPENFFKSKEEYKEWWVKNNPNFGPLSFEATWKKTKNTKFKFDEELLYKKSQLERLNKAIDEIYDGEFEPDESIVDDMRMAVLSQLTEEDVRQLSSGLLKGSHFTTEEKNAILKNARIKIYNDQQEKMAPQYDVLLEEKKVIDEATAVIEADQNDLLAERELLEARRSEMMENGRFEYNKIGQEREQWVPNSAREFVDFQADVEMFENKLDIFKSQQAVYDAKVEDYNLKAKEFVKKEEDLQAMLAYSVVDGTPVFDKSIKSFSVRSAEWQESLRNLLGRDTWYAKTLDSFLSFAKPFAGMTADIYTFSYQAGIAFAGFASDEIGYAAGYKQRGVDHSNFEAVLNMMTRGGYVQNLIPTSQTEDTRLTQKEYRNRELFGIDMSGSPVFSRTKMKEDATLYMHAKNWLPVFAYPLVLVRSNAKLQLKQVQKYKSKGFKTFKNRFHMKGASKIDRLAWQYLGIARIQARKAAPGSKKLINMLSPSFKMTENAARKINMINVTMKVLTNQNIAYARSQGLSHGDSIALGTFMSLITGLSQTIMPDYEYFSGPAGKALLSQTVKGLLKADKTVKGVIRNKAKQAIFYNGLKNFAKEHLEEQIDVIGNDLAKMTFIAQHSPDFLDDAVQEQILIGTSIVAGSFAAFKGYQDNKFLKPAVISGYRNYGVKLLNKVDLEIEAIEQVLSEAYRKDSGSRYYKEVIKINEALLDQKMLVKQKAEQWVRVLSSAGSKYVTNNQVVLLAQLDELVDKKKELQKQPKSIAASELDAVNEKIKSLEEQVKASGIDTYSKKLIDKINDATARALKSIGGHFLKFGTDEYTEQIELENKKRKEHDDLIDKEIESLPRYGKNAKKAGQLRPESVKRKAELESKRKGQLSFDENIPGNIIYNDETKQHIVIVNEDYAMDAFNLAVGVHELFHAVLRETMNKNPKLMIKMAFVLREELAYQASLGNYTATQVLGKFNLYEGGKLTRQNADELFTILAEMLIEEGGINISDGFFSKASGIFRQISRDYFNSDIKITDKQSLVNFIKDFNREAIRGKFSKGFKKVFENGIEDNFEGGAKASSFARSAMSEESESAGQSKSNFYRKKLVDDIGLGESTKLIVAENDRLREKILEEGIEKDGKIVASPELQLELVSNNMGAAIKLGMFAAKNPKIMGLEADKRVTADQFISGYYKELTELAGTYDATKAPFGAYMNSMLPLRYNQILNAEKAGAIEGRVSIDSEEAKELEDTGSVENEKNQEENIKKKNAARKIGIYKKAYKVMEEGYLLLKQGPAKTKKLEAKRIARLKELGFVREDGAVIDINELTYANMPNMLYRLVAEHFGIDPEKLNPYVKKPFAKNLRREGDKGTNELLLAQMAIQKIGIEFFAAIMPEGHTKAFKTTGIGKTKWKVLYNKSSKRIKNDYPWFKKPVTDTALMLDMLGIIDGKSFREGRDNQQSVISLINIFGKLMSNQVLRDVLNANGDLDERIQQSLEDGLSNYAESKTYRKALPEIQQEIRNGLNQVATLLYQRGINFLGTKDFDQEVRDIFKEVYGDRLGRGVRTDLVNDLLATTGLLNQFGLKNKNYVEAGLMPPDIQGFLEENLNREDFNDQQIYEAFGITGVKPGDKISKSTFFTARMLQRGRKSFMTMLNDLDALIGQEITIDGEQVIFTEKMAYEWILYMKKMYDGASQAGNDTYTFDNGSLVYKKKKGSKRGGRQLAQVATSAEDFYALVNNSKSRFNIKSISEVKERFEIKIYDEKSKSVMREIFEGTFDFSARKEQAMKARALTKWMLTHSMKRANNDKDAFDAGDMVQLYYMLASSMESPSRKSAYVYGIADNAFEIIGMTTNKRGKRQPNYDLAGSELEYDHMKPHHVAMLKSIEVLRYSPEEDWDSEIDDIFSDFAVNIIPKTMDTAVKKMGMQYDMQNGYKGGLSVEDLRGAMGRLYDSKLYGDPRIRVITSLDGKKTKFGVKFTKITKPTLSINQQSKSIKYQKAYKKSKEMRVAGVTKGISIWDFDDTLARSKSNVLFTAPDGSKGKLTAEEFAKVGADLLADGYVYDFSEFSQVVEGETGPFFEKALARAKKFGVKDQFILTARPENSNVAIYEFLKGVGLKIPFKNITGLANSTPEAKALWIVDKVSEGYNDIYFADDALANVQVVEDVLNQFDIKSKVQLAKQSQSKNYSKDFNDMISRKKGIASNKKFSDIKGQKRGQSKGKYRFFIPPSAEDFMGLLYNFVGKGKQGDADIKLLKQALVDPYTKAVNLINSAKQLIRNEYNALLKNSPDIRKKLTQKTEDGDFIYEDAVRVYLWTQAGFDIPGLSQADKTLLNDIVINDPDLLNFAKRVGAISRVSEGYVEPEIGWDAASIKYDLGKTSHEIRRDEYLKEFKENREAIFGKWENGRLVGENMNKIEAAYGPNVREALDDVLWRMENGTNRSYGKSKIVNQFMNYINGSVATTMFVNIRSALLQTLSMANFINWDTNTIFMASRAFANQKQFWADFLMLFSSDMLKQRRSGLTQDLNSSELFAYVGRSRNKTLAAISYLLQKGFLPTQIADSFAIAMGGASYYRNVYNSYLEQGLSPDEAHQKAFNDFQQIAEETQQSADPMLISQQQASPLGRLILAFANTPMQYTRLQKKAFLNLINRRGDWRSNVSRIIYYGAVQNFIFSTLQAALFALPFLDDEEREEVLDKKSQRVLNTMLDSTLRGIGIYGAAVSTIKNMVLQFQKQDEKGWRGDYAYVLIEFLNMSPPLGIKARKLYSGLMTYKYNKEEIKEGDLALQVEMGSNVVEALTNVPVNRLYNKFDNVKEAVTGDYETWKRVAMLLGWSQWNLGSTSTTKKKGKRRARKKSVTRERALRLRTR